MREYCAYCGHKTTSYNKFDVCEKCYDKIKVCVICGEKYEGYQSLVCSDRCLDKWYEENKR